jgi:hypothetical protein
LIFHDLPERNAAKTVHFHPGPQSGGKAPLPGEPVQAALCPEYHGGALPGNQAARAGGKQTTGFWENRAAY